MDRGTFMALRATGIELRVFTVLNGRNEEVEGHA